MSDRKTVRVRIPVGISADGSWSAFSWGGVDGMICCESEWKNTVTEMMGDHTLDAIHYVEADVPIPLADRQTIEGKVDTETGGTT